MANGASPAEIKRVIRGACTEVAKNVGETVVEGVIEEAKESISYNDEDSLGFGLSKLGIGTYLGSVVGIATRNPILALKTATETTKYLNENPFTISAGVQLSGAEGLGASGSYALVLDSKGNLVMQNSFNVGGGTPSAGASLFVSVTNAPSYEILESDPKEGDIPSLVSGGSYSGGVSVGYDYTYIVADGSSYSGHTVSAGVGIGAPIPAELHSEISFTWTDKVLVVGVE